MVPAKSSRVFVGLDGTIESLQALRLASREARQRAAELSVVYVRPSNSDYVYEVGFLADTGRTTAWFDQRAQEYLDTWLEEGLGQAPTDISISRKVAQGKPGRALVKLADREDDLLVVGVSQSRAHRIFSRSTSKYCTAHAVCPVLVVPPGKLAREARNRHTRGDRDIWTHLESRATREEKAA